MNKLATNTNEDKIIWRPDSQSIEHANITRFMRKYGIKTYEELHQKSVKDVRWFWRAALEDLGVEWFAEYSNVLDDSAGFPWARWFVGGSLNIVHNCVDRHVLGGRGSERAIVWEAEDGEVVTYTFSELQSAVNQLANALQEYSVGKGDYVGLFLPMMPEVVISMFACQKIGVIPVPIFSGYGADAVATRLSDARAKMVITVDGTLRKGRAVDLKSVIDEACSELASVEKIIVLKRTNNDVVWNEKRDLWWHEVVKTQSPHCTTQSLSAEHEALVLYTSGTTGRPKGCVHTHAGALAQIAKEVGYNFDLRVGERFFWMTDIGWMMGPWELIGALFHGACVVLMEGAPNFPEEDRLWRICADHKVTHLGISPTAIRVLKTSDTLPKDKHNLSSLRMLGSTGEPWDNESYMWFFEQVGGGRCPIINISGGTEIIGCHLAPLPIHPLKSSTLQGPGLGMDVDVFNEDGESVREEIGYLVCKQPAPSMTKGFLNDRERYLETYFNKWPNVWNHGDWAYVDADGYWFLRGRSDDTIKVAGKRIGPAEIEGALMQHPSVAEAATIGVPDQIKGEVIICFVVTKSDVDKKNLSLDLKKLVANVLGKPMQPKEIHFVSALPKTRSAKIVRGSIKKKWLGENLGDTSMLENPLALDAIPTSIKGD